MRSTNAKKLLSLLLITVIFLFSTPILSSAEPSLTAFADGGDRADEEIEIGSRFAELIFGKRGNGEKRNESRIKYLCPGGDTFGVKICDGGVTVSKVIAPLESGSLLVDDKILSIDGKEVFSISDVKAIISSSADSEIPFSILRDGKTVTEYITPSKAGTQAHLGVLLSDVTSGIGTITYFDPVSLDFGGLGHGILEKDGKCEVKMTHGLATGVILGGINKGKNGQPGELRGVLTDRPIGKRVSNTDCGVFGKLSKAPSETSPIPCAARTDVQSGEATIISTVKNGLKAEYSINISDIDYSSSGTKSFKITVTDDTLTALTGGIVRGMSGSPIIQNGKLVGAVTHVLINDPTTGYGIFIENMLNASEIARNELPAA